MSELRNVPPSGVALKTLLEEDGEEAKAIREAIHRTQLWRFTTGRGKPGADNLAQIAALSRGRVPADGWGDGPATLPPGSP